jgi:hypothetical protein
MAEKYVKIVAENLNEFRDLNKLNEEQVNEALFGLNDQDKAKVKELAGKPALEDADIDANTKLIKSVLDSFKPTTLGGAQDAAIKAKGMLVANPKSYKQTILNFLKVYTQGLADTTKAKFYKLDANKKLIPYVNAVSKASVGAELGQ